MFPGCQVHDFGDLNFTQVPNDELYNNLVLYPRSVGLATQMLADAVSRAVAAGHRCVTLGGDHRWADLKTISGSCCRSTLGVQELNWKNKGTWGTARGSLLGNTLGMALGWNTEDSYKNLTRLVCDQLCGHRTEVFLFGKVCVIRFLQRNCSVSLLCNVQWRVSFAHPVLG